MGPKVSFWILLALKKVAEPPLSQERKVGVFWFGSESLRSQKRPISSKFMVLGSYSPNCSLWRPETLKTQSQHPTFLPYACGGGSATFFKASRVQKLIFDPF